MNRDELWARFVCAVLQGGDTLPAGCDAVLVAARAAQIADALLDAAEVRRVVLPRHPNGPYRSDGRGA